MKTIAEEVLCKHNECKCDMETLADELAVATINNSCSKTYIYDDDSYTTIMTGGEQHITGKCWDVTDYNLYPREDTRYEGECVVPILAEEIKPVKPLSTGYKSAILKLAVKRYTANLQKQTLENQKSQPAIELETSDEERTAWNELKHELKQELIM